MEITSIGFLSETLFQHYSGSVRNYGDCMEVRTHPNYRRQGICAALVHYVSCTEQVARPGNRMVILADHGEPAERIYKSLGYVEIEQIQSVVLRPKGWDG